MKHLTIVTLNIFLLSLAFVTGSFGGDTHLTVYTSDLMLVREVTTLKMLKGEKTYSFTDIPSSIDPSSVQIAPVKSISSFSVLEQRFEKGIFDVSGLLPLYEDRDVRVFLDDGSSVEGRITAITGRSFILSSGDGRVHTFNVNKMMHIEYPPLPEDTVLKPTLFFLIGSKASRDVDCELTYLTGNVGWNMEYTAEISEDESSLNFSGMVSIHNNCGYSFKNAKLKLVAGDIHRIKKGIPIQRARMAKEALFRADAAGEQFEERGLMEYHLYELKRTADIKDGEVKQIIYLPGKVLKSRKIFEYRSTHDPRAVKLKLAFMNSRKDGLGIPVPAGRVRLFKNDSDGISQFIGEDKIAHTPKDIEIRLTVGSAFDLTGERKVLDQRRISRYITEEDIEITLKNRKDDDVEIVVVEDIYGFSEIVQSRPKYEKKDARTVEFHVRVTAGGEEKVTYRIRRK